MFPQLLAWGADVKDGPEAAFGRHARTTAAAPPPPTRHPPAAAAPSIAQRARRALGCEAATHGTHSSELEQSL